MVILHSGHIARWFGGCIAQWLYCTVAPHTNCLDASGRCRKKMHMCVTTGANIVHTHRPSVLCPGHRRHPAHPAPQSCVLGGPAAHHVLEYIGVSGVTDRGLRDIERLARLEPQPSAEDRQHTRDAVDELAYKQRLHMLKPPGLRVKG